MHAARNAVPKKTKPVPIDDFAPHVTMTDRVFGAIDSISGKAFLVQFALPIVGFAGSAVGKVGQWVKLKPVAKAGERIHGATDSASKYTFEQLGNRLGVSKSVGRMSDAAAGRAERIFSGVTTRLGIAGRNVRKHTGKAYAHLLDGQQQLSDLLKHEALPSELRPHLDVIHAATNAPHMHAIDKARFSEGMEALSKCVAENPETSKPVAKLAARMQKSLSKAMNHHELAEAWKKPGSNFKSATRSLSKSSVVEKTVDGLWVASSGIALAKDTHDFFGSVKQLKQMYADIKGVDPRSVSTARVLFGNVPEAVRDARRKITGATLISELADAAGLLVTLKMVKGHGLQGASGAIRGTMALMAPQLIGGGAKALIGQPLLTMYQALRQAHRQGQVSAEDYATFLASACRELKNKGPSNAFTMELAKQYAEANASPGDILRDIENGTVMKRISLLIAANEKAQAPASVAPQASHVQRVTGGAETRQVVGKHTGELAKAQTGAIEQGI